MQKYSPEHLKAFYKYCFSKEPNNPNIDYLNNLQSLLINAYNDGFEEGAKIAAFFDGMEDGQKGGGGREQ